MDLRTRQGLTLVEMLVVVAVIALLATILVRVASHIDTQNKYRSLESSFAVVEAALSEYYDRWNTFPDPNAPRTPAYPSSSAALYGQLWATPSARKVLSNLSESAVRRSPVAPDMPEFCDPWGTEWRYVYKPGDAFPQLISAGPDRDFTTVSDNISSR